jgi:hypothetical protein
MAIQDRLSALTERIGRPISILRNAGNIADHCILLDIASSNPFMSEIAKNSIFAWNSEMADGDIFQDTVTEERFMVVNANFWVHGSVRDGKQALVYKCNDLIVLYQWVEGAVTNEYGKKVFNLPVKLNDYAVVSYSTKGDTLNPIGDVSFDKLFVTFSGRNLGIYKPKQGDRIVLLNGKILQIDGIDDHLYAGCYETICSLDQRV